MKAHKFVAEKGIERAKAVLEGAPDWANFWISRDQYHCSVMSFPNMTGHYSIDLSELKQVVESVEIVESKGGLRKLKKEANCLFYNGFEGIAESYEKSIADYESIYGGEHV